MISIDDLIQHHSNKCARYTNGMCYIHRCLKRGGWSPYHTEHNDLRTVPSCEEHETIQALIRLQMMEETWEHVRLMFPQASQVCNYYIPAQPDQDLVYILNGDLHKLDEVTHNIPEELKSNE